MRHGARRPPGPPKQFDTQRTLERARDLFWRRGFDGTGLSELEGELGVGRKSLYDTFGNKRALYLASLAHYGDSVIAAICDGLERPGASPLANLERVLGKLARHHASGESHGCLLGVGLAQVQRDDAEIVAALRRELARLEDAFERTLQRALDAGELRPNVRPRDSARQLVAFVQGMALLGRIADSPAVLPTAMSATLDGLRR
ncbi:MAG: TetR/AcrR family transcriptional regulator [Planctomycetota bacterium]|nr:MAG: TetR/AcrR family transcriptional regulator [Planctomycetota bacterium]